MALAVTEALSPTSLVLLVVVASYCAGAFPSQLHAGVLLVVVEMLTPERSQDATAALPPQLFPLLDSILQRLREEIDDPVTASGVCHTVTSTLKHIHLMGRLAAYVADSKMLLVESQQHGVQLAESLGLDSPTRFLTRSSVLGRFVVGVVLNFEVLDFDKSAELFAVFAAFVGVENGRSDNSLFARVQATRERLTGNSSPAPTAAVLRVDVNQYVEHQLEMLERHGGPVPHELHQVLASMAHHMLPLAHYLRYLEALHADRYEQAFAWLHRYFDYMMLHDRRSFYHYALLLLATLHAHFGLDHAALDAIQEALAVARENKDLTCLAFLLAWVHGFVRDRPALHARGYSSSHQLLEFLRTRAPEALRALHATAFQLETLDHLDRGSASAKVFADWQRACFVASNDSPGTYVRNCDLLATVWSRAGVPALAHAYTDIGRDMCHHFPNVLLEVAAAIRTAYLWYDSGRCDEAVEMLRQQQLDKRCTSNSTVARMLEARLTVLQVRLAVSKGRYTAARVLLQRLEQQRVANVDVEAERRFLEAWLLSVTGEPLQALEVVGSSAPPTHYWKVRYGYLAARIYTACGAPARGLTRVVQLQVLARALGWPPLVAEGSLVLAEVLHALGRSREALGIVQQALPRVWQVCDVETCALACLLMGVAAPERRQELVEYIAQAVELYKLAGCFPQVLRCFEAQAELGRQHGDAELAAHGNAAAATVQQRLREEGQYGVV